MIADCRPIFADERSASRAVFYHATMPSFRQTADPFWYRSPETSPIMPLRRMLWSGRLAFGWKCAIVSPSAFHLSDANFLACQGHWTDTKTVFVKELCFACSVETAF